MNNAGRSDPEDKIKTEDTADNTTTGRRSPILLVLLASVLIICLIIGVQAFGILYSIVFPPMPPLPDNTTETRHTSIDHGVDEWVYETDQDACAVMSYYQSQDGLCRVAANVCGEAPQESVSFGAVGQHIATCIGEVKFNIFAYRWEANIADGSQDGVTQFSLIREVFWTGEVPPRLDPRKGFDFDG